MSHGSGIPIAPELDHAFGSARTDNNVRFLQVRILNETLVDVAKHPLSNSIEDDWKALHKYIERNVASYFIFRLDSKNINGYEWVLISYVPDGSPVKERMLYASTRALLKRQLGLSYFSDEFHSSSPDDLSYELFVQHDKKKGTGNSPLTEAEIASHAELTSEIDHGHTREYVHSVRFPFSSSAIEALQSLQSSSVFNVVHLAVDDAKETVELVNTSNHSSINAFHNYLNDHQSSPSFFFFRFDHQFNDQSFSPILFIFYCPENSKVKLKMLYSTVKSTAIDAAKSYNVNVEKKLEISEASDLNESELMTELHPQSREVQVKTGFSRPARPGKGPSRVTRK